MNLINPLINTRDSYRHLSWKHFKNKVIYHLELILPLKGTVRKYADGAYWTIAAEVLKDSEVNGMMLQKDTQIVMDLPVRTFERAFVGSTPIIFRQGFQEHHNLRIKFEKKTKQSMFITEIEKLQVTFEQQQFADKVYSNMDKYSPDNSYKINKRREEVL